MLTTMRIIVCLAIPAKVLSIKHDIARVDFGQGTVKDVNVSLVDVKVGNYVLVHAGFAVQTMDAKSAEKTLELWREVLASAPETS